MSIKIKKDVDIIAMLRDAGLTTYKLRHDKLLAESTLTKIRRGVLPSWHELDVICDLLNKQPGDFVEFVKGCSDSPRSEE